MTIRRIKRGEDLFTNRELIEATGLVCRCLSDSLPQASQCEHTFSVRFQEDIGLMVEQYDRRRTKLHRKRCLSVAVACFLAFLLWFAVDTGTRASVIGWIKEIYNKVIIYHMGGKEDNSVSSIGFPQWIPEGYVQEEESRTEQHCYVRFQATNNSDKGFIVEYRALVDGRGNLELLVGTKAYEHQFVTINEFHGELYICGDGTDTNNLIWIDEERNVLFSINGTLTADELIRIAESFYEISK